MTVNAGACCLARSKANVLVESNSLKTKSVSPSFLEGSKAVNFVRDNTSDSEKKIRPWISFSGDSFLLQEQLFPLTGPGMERNV